MNYDLTDIPVVYDRGRDHGPKILQLWMDIVSAAVESRRLNNILDLGCGTGRFSEALAAHFNAEVIGIDPSTRMLEQAQTKLRDQRVRYQLGCGEAIPLPDDSVDLVFMSMSFHHFKDRRLAARECHRVLRDGGTAILRTGIRERIPSYPYVEFFPASLPIMEDLLPTETFVLEAFTAAQFCTRSASVVIQEIAADYAAYIEKVLAGADSVLAQLSPTEFQSGIDAMRAHAACVSDKPVSEPIDVFVFSKR